MGLMFDKKIKFLQEYGFSISFEIEKSYYQESKDHEDKGFYCSLYFGDSNGPWKPGTISGCGYGESLEECLEDCIKDLQIVGKKDELIKIKKELGGVLK